MRAPKRKVIARDENTSRESIELRAEKRCVLESRGTHLFSCTQVENVCLPCNRLPSHVAPAAFHLKWLGLVPCRLSVLPHLPCLFPPSHTVRNTAVQPS